SCADAVMDHEKANAMIKVSHFRERMSGIIERCILRGQNKPSEAIRGGSMTRLLIAIGCITLLVTLAIAGGQSQRQPAGTAHNGAAFRFNKVAEGVYHAVGTGTLTVVGNSSVIVNDDDVIIVDDHVSPAAAWVLMDELKDITTKPARYVINTHFHYDHAHGNQVFDKDVAIIGHEFTREMLVTGKSLQMPLYRSYVTGLPGGLYKL